MQRNLRSVLQATVILLAPGITLNAQPTQVTEIPTASTGLVKAGDFVYFTSSDSLLRTDGTESGTTFLRSGFTDGFSELTEFNSMLFFISGDELWRSDGTTGGTILLVTKSELQILSGTGETLFFTGSDAATGQELYRTDGTSAGTMMARDINPGPGDGFLGNSGLVGAHLYFRGNNGVNGNEPWKSNGTAAGTMMIEDINPGAGNGFVSGNFDDDFVYGSPYEQGHVYSYNNQFFFSGYTVGSGQEPWVSDGTATGTFILKDVEPGAEDPAWILYGIGHHGSVYFITKPHTDISSGPVSATLWKTSGTTASTVSLSPLIVDESGQEDDGVTYADPFRIYDGKVYFFGRQYLGGHELWVSDGTPSGTHAVYTLSNDFGDYTMIFFEVVDGYLLFYGTMEAYPTALYRSDGTNAGTTQWIHFASEGHDTGPFDVTAVGDLIFFGDHDGPTSAGGSTEDPDDYYQLFQADPSQLTNQSVRSIHGVSTSGTLNIVDYNGKVLFQTRNYHEEATDREKYLWIYDPNSSGNEQVGKIRHEIWNNVTGTKVSAIPIDEEPSSVNDLTIFEIPANVADNYGSRVRGYVMVPETGNYTFWIASDDQSQLWLSTDADPANKRKIAEVTGWTTSRQWGKYASQQSGEISLVGGRKYYIEALHKEGTGGDNLAVGWQLPGGTMERPIPGNRLMSFGASQNAAPHVVITSPEDGESFPGPATITITADASDPEGNISEVEFYNGSQFLGEDETAPYSFTWEYAREAGNYSIIAKAIDNFGAFDTDTVNITVTDDGPCSGTGMIRQEFWTGIPGTSVSSIPTDTEPDFTHDLTGFEGPATNMADNYGSRIRGYLCPPSSGEYIFYIAGDDQVELWLSTDDNPANKTRIAYHTGWTNRRQWDKYPSQKSAPIMLQANKRYYIEALMKEGSGADHVSVALQHPTGGLSTPIPGNYLIPFEDSHPEPACAGTGTISVETWTGIDGVHVSSIPVDSEPNLSGERDIFEAPTNIGSNFGSRFRGYLCAPTTGSYTFWIASDDHSELWLSTDADPANKVRIAYQTGWTNPRQWTKYATQQSAPISLVAGQQYYIEALYKEDEGGDNMAVGWQLPDGTMERPIPGNRLSPFGESSAAMASQSISSEQQLYEQISVYPNPARSGDPELTISGYEGIDRTIETRVEIINMTGDVVFSENVLCGGDCGSYLMRVNKQLVPGVYVVNMQTNGVRTAKRLLVK